MFQDSTNATIHNDDYLDLLRKIKIQAIGVFNIQISTLWIIGTVPFLKAAFVHSKFVLTVTSSQKTVIIFSRIIVFMKNVIKINLPMLK
jgi:hypothetical protein